MSIKLGRYTTSGTSSGQGNKLSISNQETPYVVDLNIDNENANETYIRFGTDIHIGSSNQLFVFRNTTTNDDLLTLTTDTIGFPQDVELGGLSVIGNTILQSTTVHNSFTTSNNTHLFGGINVTESNVNVTKECVFDNSVTTFNGDIVTSRIQAPSTNTGVLIDGLILESINTDSINIVQTNTSTDIFTANKNNTCNYVDFKTNDISLFTINNIGNIGVNDSNPQAILTAKSIQNDLVRLEHDDFNISQSGHINIGVYKTHTDVVDFITQESKINDSFVHIHRKDDGVEHTIKSDPLVYMTTDYDYTNNYRTLNYRMTNFGFTPYINSVSSEFEHRIVLSLLPPNNIPEYRWYTIGTEIPITTNIMDDNNPTRLFIQSYDYNVYNLDFINMLGDNAGLLTTDIATDNIIANMLVGFWTNEGSDVILRNHLIAMRNDVNNIDTLALGFNGYDLVKLQDTYQILPTDDKTITINYFILVERLPTTELPPMYYIDSTPTIIEPPMFLSCECNNDIRFSVSGKGHASMNGLNVQGDAYIQNLSLDKLTDNFDMMNHNIDNFGILSGNAINVHTIRVGDAVEISSDRGLIMLTGGSNVIENRIEVANINNINSDFFKYNDQSTFILNKFNIGNDKSKLDTMRESINHDVLISGSGVFLDGDMDITSNIVVGPSKDFTFGVDKDYRVETQLDGAFDMVLRLQDTNNTNYLQCVNSNISMGTNGTVNISTTKRKMTIGIPDQMIERRYNSIHDVDNWYKDFNDILVIPDSEFLNVHDIGASELEIFNKNTVMTVYGTSRFSNRNNRTLVDIREHDEDIPNENNYKTMNVYGSIHCERRKNNIGEDLDDVGLHVDGNAHIEGKVFATSGISSLSDKRFKTDLEPITKSLEKIKQLTGYTFTHKGVRDTGLLAQDVQDILPEAVTEDDDKRLNLSYGNLMGLIVEGIKELDEKMTSIISNTK